MSEKTILKLHANGDFETIDTQLRELDNLFVKHTCVRGYLNDGNELRPQEEEQEWASDYIPVSEGDYVLQGWWEHVNNTDNSYITICTYGENQNFFERTMRFMERGAPYYERVFTFSSAVKFVRICVGFLATFGKAQFLKGNTPKPHKLSQQDLIEQGVPLYSFTDSTITVPTIIKIPPYRNNFIEKTIVRGFLERDGTIGSQTEGEITSDFISLDGWNNTTIRIRYENKNGAHWAWHRISFFTSQKTVLYVAKDGYIDGDSKTGNYTFELQLQIPTNAAFLRVSTNYYQTSGVTVKISVEKGYTTNTTHYPAIEDMNMPEWVRDTGNPISIFPQGIVIKGNLIQTEPVPEPEPPGGLVFKDDFNRADANSLGGEWTVVSGHYSIKDGLAKPTGTYSMTNTAIVDVGESDNLRISATTTPFKTEALVIRYVDNDNFILVVNERGWLNIRSIKNGIETTHNFISISEHYTGSFNLTVDLRGQEINAFINDTFLLSASSINFLLNSTKFGLLAWSDSGILDTIGHFDDFEIKKLPNSVIFMDDFNRPNAATLGKFWTIISGGYRIIGNAARPTNLKINNTAIVDVGIQDNINIELDVVVSNISESLVLRFKDNSNNIQVMFEAERLLVRASINDVSSDLAVASYSANSDKSYKLKVELRGTEIKVLVDDILLITTNSDLFLNTTKCGMKAWTDDNSTIGYFDNFKVERLLV